jgi:hypothetical protein
MGDNVPGAQESLYIVESALICYGERVSGLFPVLTCCLNIITCRAKTVPYEGRNRLKLSLIEGKSILLYENFYYHGYF